MKVVISYSAKDWNLAFYMIQKIVEHTDVKGENLVLYGSGAKGCPPPPDFFKKRYGVKRMRCSGDPNEYPLGPNLMFAQLMRVMASGNLGETVMLTEPDAFPTCRDWYSRVLAAHEKTNAWVSGSLVDWFKPNHLNGNLVMNAQLVRDNLVLTRPVLEAWDVHHSELLLAHGKVNLEINCPKRDWIYYPTDWWFSHKAAWVHGCQNFQAWESISNGRLDNG